MEENQLIENFSFGDTLATKKLFRLKKRIKAACGGTSASKTISILVWLIDYSQSNKNKKVDIMSESYPHLEDGAIKDFKSIMIDRGYWNDDNWNQTKHFYTFETGTVLKFISIDKLGKARGPRRDVLFINEANNIAFDIYEQLEVRTKEHIWLDWNPTNEFWYYTEIKDVVDHDFITLTYLDCISVLDPRIIASIESRKHRKGWWKVYGLGQLGEVEGKIYKNWRIIDEIPHEAKLIRRGLDFGYSNDPTSIVDIYKLNDGYILDEVTFLKGLSNKQISDILLNREDTVLVVADSAEPKSIDEIKSYGVNIIGTTKGKDSVVNGIQFVQDQQISITRRSFNIIKEYRNYLWMVDKNGKILNEPEHPFSHSMDAIRYGFSTFIIEEQSNVTVSYPD
jgi:phage terminase large subunit